MSGIDGQNLADSLVLDAFYSSLSNHQRSSLCNPRPSNDFYKIELDFDNEEKLLFSWILKHQRYHLKFVDKDETFTNTASSSSDIPDIVFSIQKKTDIKFNPDNLKATVAFHGTNLGNLYSILNYGLNSHLNKRNLYGAGIYVASDLSTALSFATPSFGRKIKSKISMGATYKVVLQCSVVLHEDVIQNREQKERSFSFDEKVPANYYVIKNNDHIRVENILIFLNRRPRVYAGNYFIKFLCKHLMIIMFASWFLFLTYAIRN